MGLHLLVFIGVAAIVIVIPGPDTAVVTKNVLIHGRRAGLGTSLVAARAAQTLMRPRVRAALDRFTGIVLIGLGLRLAVERR
jgi:threonine/homoserine/homoserine lactone efflux protein